MPGAASIPIFEYYITLSAVVKPDSEIILFDIKCHFQALKPSETGYIKPYTDEKGIYHIAIMEV